MARQFCCDDDELQDRAIRCWARDYNRLDPLAVYQQPNWSQSSVCRRGVRVVVRLVGGAGDGGLLAEYHYDPARDRMTFER
jgi:hypothetical protein